MQRNYANYDPQAEELIRWYDAERRVLPWREDPTPYHVWLSEIMLQQTRVDTVIGYYQRFLAELPDVAALAASDEDQALKLWQGLGYYSRIRNMRKAAGVVMNEYDGEIPGTPRELEKLPGIGAYVAAAVSSIAFGERVPSIDGNLLRVFARMTGYEESIKTTIAKRKAADYYLEIMPEERPGDMNQALMDLGATVCLPNGAPLCDQCPWSARCLVHQEGREQLLPIKEEKKKRRIEKRTVLRIHVGDRTVIRQRPSKGLLANLYEYPNQDGWLTAKEATAACEELGFRVIGKPKKLTSAKHIFSHLEWHMHGYEIEAEAIGDAVSETAPAEISAEGNRSMELPPFTGELTIGAPEKRTEKDVTGEETDADVSRCNPPILASREELQEIYSIPTAFANYKEE